jgi:hypothetical protein
VTTIRLLTGEEIIGRFVREDDKGITLDRPVMLGATQKGMGFLPVCISIDDSSEFTYKHIHVMFSAKTRQEIVDAYIKATTGIQLASSFN